MPVVLGTDGYRFEVVENWAKLPEGWSDRRDKFEFLAAIDAVFETASL
jgi:hypothetical protein